MKKIWILTLSVALCATLAACSGSETPPLPASPTAPAAATDTPAEPAAGTLDEMYKAYISALENLIQNQILPDGTDGGTQYGDMSENKFAVCDVDNDGREELLLLYTTTSEGGWAGFVSGYDAQTKKLRTKLRDSTFLTFYDNGIIRANWGSNQRLGGDFWPYSLYQYAPDSDSYGFVGMVDAWDKNYPVEDPQKNAFPSDIDKSGTGFVYYIMNDRQYDNSHPADASEYNKWVDAYIGEASEIQIRYMDLTEENILRLKSRTVPPEENAKSASNAPDAERE